MPQGLFDSLAEYLFKDMETPPTLGPFEIVQFDPVNMQVEATNTFTFGETYINVNYKINGFTPLDGELAQASVSSGTAVVAEATVDFGENLFGLESVQGVQTRLVAMHHMPNLLVSAPSAENLNPISGSRDGAYSRVYFSVTIETIELTELVNELLGIELPFELPTISDMSFLLAKSFSAPAVDYDPSLVPPSILPFAVRVASKDGLWLSAKVTIQSHVLKVIICSIVNRELDLEGECDATTLDFEVYMALPGVTDSSSDKEKDSFFRFGLAAPAGMSIPFPSTGFTAPSTPRFALNFAGEPYSCGWCGFKEFLGADRPTFSTGAADAVYDAISSGRNRRGGGGGGGGGSNPFLSSELASSIKDLVFPNGGGFSMAPFTMTNFNPATLAVAASSKMLVGQNSNFDMSVDLSAKLDGRSRGNLDMSSDEDALERGVAIVMDAQVDFGESLFGLSEVQGLGFRIVALRHFTDVELRMPSLSAPNPVVGKKSEGYNRLALHVECDRLELQALLEKAIPAADQLPFDLPTLTDLSLTVSKTFPPPADDDDEYDTALYPEGLKHLTSDGFWFKTDIEPGEDSLMRAMICWIKRFSQEESEECVVEPYSITGYLKLGGSNPLDESFVMLFIPVSNHARPSCFEFLPG